MKDKNDKVIYVGKASVLKNRVRQYFASQTGFSAKTAVLVQNIDSFEYIVTDSEYEALLLECNLIKKHRPKFNILLMDDKNYQYIKITMFENFPRVLSVRKYENDGSKYFGPYTSGFAVKDTIELIKKLFTLRTCRKKLTGDSVKERPCLNYHIGRCIAPCQGNVSKESYRDIVNDVTDFLNGRHEKVMEKLERKMTEASDNLDYEAAALFRNRISGLKHISEKQKVLVNKPVDRDVVAHFRKDAYACVQIFLIRNGKLIGSEQFFAKDDENADEKDLFTSFFKQFYQSREEIPGEIVSECEIDDSLLIENWLSIKKGKAVHIGIPSKGEKKQLVMMAAQNAKIALENYLSGKEKNEPDTTALLKLQELLGQVRFPERIEAFDISNTGSSEIVASMVVYLNGAMCKDEYRRYRIRSLDAPDDYAAMQEVLFRRFRKASENGRTDDANRQKMPDLILIDGGKGHVSAAEEVLNKLDIKISVYGMVKDEKHRTRALTSDKKEIQINETPEVYRFIYRIQEEAHRFAIEYNRKLGSKRYSHSALDEISGIGRQRKKALMKHFKSVVKIRQSNVDELMQAEGINIKTAEAVYRYFHGIIAAEDK